MKIFSTRLDSLGSAVILDNLYTKRGMVLGPFVRECPVPPVLLEPADIMKQCGSLGKHEILRGQIEALSDVQDIFTDPAGMERLQVHVFLNIRIRGVKPTNIVCKPGFQVLQ